MVRDRHTAGEVDPLSGCVSRVRRARRMRGCDTIGMLEWQILFSLETRVFNDALLKANERNILFHVVLPPRNRPCGRSLGPVMSGYIKRSKPGAFLIRMYENWTPSTPFPIPWETWVVANWLKKVNMIAKNTLMTILHQPALASVALLIVKLLSSAVCTYSFGVTSLRKIVMEQEFWKYLDPRQSSTLLKHMTDYILFVYHPDLTRTGEAGLTHNKSWRPRSPWAQRW